MWVCFSILLDGHIDSAPKVIGDGSSLVPPQLASFTHALLFACIYLSHDPAPSTSDPISWLLIPLFLNTCLYALESWPCIYSWLSCQCHGIICSRPQHNHHKVEYKKHHKSSVEKPSFIYMGWITQIFISDVHALPCIYRCLKLA